MLGFNDVLTLVGHFVSIPENERKEKEKIVEETKERTGKKEEKEWRWRNERNKNIPLYSYLL